MENHFTGYDWLVLAAYFAATIGIGLSFSRKSRNSEGFTAANRSLPGWVCGLSIFATFLSSISFLALPGRSFAGNWMPFAFSLSLPIATWIAIRWFLPYYRKSGEISAYAHLENRFGPWARIYTSSFYLLTQLARTGMVLYLMALPLSVILGVPISSLLLVTGAVVTAYALVGGIVAVIWTDALQAIVLIAGALCCLIVMLVRIPGGIPELATISAEHAKFSLGSFDPTLLGVQTFWVVFLNGLFINLQNFGIDQSYVQRYIAASSEKEARRSVWLGGLLYIPVSAVFFLIGTSLFAFYQAHPADLADVRQTAAAQQILREGGNANSSDFNSDVIARASTLTDSNIADSVFPHFIGKQLPPGLTGLLISAVLAAGMSTVSTSLNSAATIIHRDYFLRFIRPEANEKQSILTLRLATLIFGIIGTSVSFLLLNISSALDAWWTLSSIFSGGILGLFLLGMASRANNTAAISAVTAGLLAIAWMILSNRNLWPASLSGIASPFHDFLIIVVGTLTILTTGFSLTIILPRRRSQ
jgi:SSS family solute:Na+ symporter